MDHFRSLTYCFALLSLMHGDKYGVEIQKYVSMHYCIEISLGALYPMLKALEAEGYIAQVADRHISQEILEIRRGKPPKYYRITKSGAEYLRCLRECFSFDDDDRGDPPDATDPQFDT
ncbi:MAG: PadR family transcriptional regulator [Geitlerinemataceae cyanobacterium]